MRLFLKITFMHLMVLPILFIYSCAGREKMYRHAQSTAPYDVVIVPGLPYNSGDISAGMKLRILWSYHLYRTGMTKKVMYSGSAVYSPYVEARIMAEYGKALGIPTEDILMEERAEHSTENLFFGYRMAKNLGYQKIALASDPFQSSMLRSFARSRDMDVDFIPAIYDTLNAYWAVASLNIDPEVARVDSFVALPERESFFTRLRGTFGKNIRAIEKKEREAGAPRPEDEQVKN